MPRTTTPTTATASNSILSTRSYDQFVFLNNNRDTETRHIDALVQAFENYGNLTKAQPILVNEEMQVIDGQHRLLAAQRLEQPVFYTVVPGLSIGDARQMNLLHRNWTTEDFAKSYATSGVTAYQKYLQLREEYEQFNHSVVIAGIYGANVKGTFKRFREGELEITNEEAARQRLDMLADINERFGVTRAVAYALVKMFDNPNYEHERLLRKLDQLPEFRSFESVTDNLRSLEEVYNYMYSDINRVRFF